MSEYTENCNLELPLITEKYDVEVANKNNRIIDNELGKKAEKIPGKSFSTNDFTDAYKRKLEGLKNYNDTEIKQEISNIKAKNDSQDTETKSLEAKISELEKENTELKKDIEAMALIGEAEGENITLNDSSGARLKKIEISGNSKQETEASFESQSDVECCGDNGNITIATSNENLYNYKDVVSQSSRITTDEAGWITCTSDNSSGTSTQYPAYFTSNLRLKENTNYAIVAEIKNVTGTGMFMLNDVGNSTEPKKGQFTTPTTYLFNKLENNSVVISIRTTRESLENVVHGLKTCIRFNIGESGSITFRLSVLEDTKVTPDSFIYKPYQEQKITIPVQQPFRKIGDVRDTFVEKDGKRYERHNICRKIFDGTEDWKMWSVSGNTVTQRFYLKIDGALLGNHLCNCLSYLPGTADYEHMNHSMNSTTKTNCELVVYINRSRLSTVDAAGFKALLAELYNAGTPLYVDYLAETPVDLLCTEKQNKALDKLDNIRTYKNVTYINSTDKISPNMKATYCKDLETVINNINNAITVLGGETNV